MTGQAEIGRRPHDKMHNFAPKREAPPGSFIRAVIHGPSESTDSAIHFASSRGMISGARVSICCISYL